MDVSNSVTMFVPGRLLISWKVDRSPGGSDTECALCIVTKHPSMSYCLSFRWIACPYVRTPVHASTHHKSVQIYPLTLSVMSPDDTICNVTRWHHLHCHSQCGWRSWRFGQRPLDTTYNYNLLWYVKCSTAGVLLLPSQDTVEVLLCSAGSCVHSGTAQSLLDRERGPLQPQSQQHLAHLWTGALRPPRSVGGEFNWERSIMDWMPHTYLQLASVWCMDWVHAQHRYVGTYE